MAVEEASDGVKGDISGAALLLRGKGHKCHNGGLTFKNEWYFEEFYFLHMRMTEREEDINARHKTKDHHAYREIGFCYKFFIFIWLQIKVYPRFFIQKLSGGGGSILCIYYDSSRDFFSCFFPFLF